MMFRVGSLVVLVLMASLALAGITPLANLKLKPGNVVYQRVGMYSRGDSPFGSNALVGNESPHTFIRLNWKLDSKTNTSQYDPAAFLGEIAWMHHKYRPGFGTGGRLIEEKYFCCTEELYNKRKCSVLNHLILNVTFPLNGQKTADNLFYYDAHRVGEYTDLQHNHDDHLHIGETGVYYLFLANCHPEATVTVSGIIEWLNPYGYLPGQILGYLPSYWLLFVLYTPLLLWYFLISMRHRHDLLGLQIGVLVFLFVAWLENLLWGCDYIVYNGNGYVNDAVNVFGALFTAVKSTGIRLVLLLCGLGYSITKPVLRKGVTVAVVLLTLLYFAVAAVDQYLLVARAAGSYVDEVTILFFDVLLILVNSAFGGWIAVALHMQMRSLRKSQQTDKHKLYKRLVVLLIVAILIALIFYIAQVSLVFSDLEDGNFRVWWLWETFWEFFYYVVAFAIAVIWRPNEKNLRYAFANEVPTDEMAARAASAGGHDDIVQLEEQSERPKAASSSSSSSS